MDFQGVDREKRLSLLDELVKFVEAGAKEFRRQGRKTRAEIMTEKHRLAVDFLKAHGWIKEKDDEVLRNQV